MLYSIRWDKVSVPKSKPNTIHVQTTFLDTHGHVVQKTRLYEEWLGVCTNNIHKVVRLLDDKFPDCNVRFTRLGTTRKVLPYFQTRLDRNKLDSPEKPFYKVFIQACHAEVGRFFKKYKMSYYDKADWRVRLYIDLCTQYNTKGFLYKWYSVTNDSPWLLQSFQMHPERTDIPDWTIAAFDLETVPMDGSNHVPNGFDPADEIVMISVYKWNRRGTHQWLFYRSPAGPVDFEHGVYYTSEKDMLNDFHAIIQDCQILTGYNINGFDLPCLFARLIWLKMNNILKQYSSFMAGQTLVTTFQQKMVVDLYHYFKRFSEYDLPSFKLDDVARVKLKETKIPINATGIWCWYTHPKAATMVNQPLEVCYNTLKPRRIALNQFGTFQNYMAYCLKDSLLVKQLFEKEMVLSFLVERANFTAGDAVKALHLGNSSFLLDLFETYGTMLGFFINTHFFKSPIDPRKYKAFNTKNDTYQGALNFCQAEEAFEDISVLDFAGMYPSALLSSNLCYSTCTIMTRAEWLACPQAHTLTCLPYRNHTDDDFKTNTFAHPFQYPRFDPDQHEFAIVINEKTEAFLPCVVQHFTALRKYHQTQYKQTKDVYHYNSQLCIKILVNSLYGTMANKNSCLSYVPIAMIIVNLARNQLLGSYHYISSLGYQVCYADTDSLMVHRWPHNHCDNVNHYLNLPHVELKYEGHFQRLVVLSRKRYVYETDDGKIVTKGSQKRTNDLLQFLTNLIVRTSWCFIFGVTFPDLQGPWLESGLSLESRGWVLWVSLLQETLYKCRDPKKYCISRKTKPLSEYKSKTCATVRMLERYPEKANDYIDYAYSRADVAQKHVGNWVLDVQDCQWPNYEQLIVNQKKMFCRLLNIACWKRPTAPMAMCDMVMNAIRWKQFMHAELLYQFKTGGRQIELLVEKGIKYTFCVNEHKTRESGRLPRRRKTTNPQTDGKRRKVTSENPTQEM